MKTPIRFAFGLLLALGSPMPLAGAQDARPAHRENAHAAQALFDEGMRFLQSHRFAEACPKFEESQRLDPALGTEFQLGSCYERTGLIASAWKLFRDVEEKTRGAGQKERADIAKKRADALEPRLPRLRIDVPAERAGSADLEIRRDGTVVGRDGWGVPTPIDPGEHVVVFETSADVTIESVQVVERQLVAVTASPLEPAPKPDTSDSIRPARTATPPAVMRSTESRPPDATTQRAHAGSTQRIVGLMTAGVGVAGLGVGTWLGLAAKSRWDESNDHGDCDPSGCNEAGLSARDDGRSKALASTVIFGAGAAALLTGTILFFTAPVEDGRTVAVRPMAGIDGRGGLEVRGTFR